MTEPQITKAPNIRRYRRKPSLVDEALRYLPNVPGNDLEAIKAWGVVCDIAPSLRIWVTKSQAWCHVSTGDYVVQEHDRFGFYVCADEDFWRTHETPED